MFSTVGHPRDLLSGAAAGIALAGARAWIGSNPLGPPGTTRKGTSDMMGYGHAAMGAAGFLALTSSSSLALGIAPQPLPVVATGALLTAGAALLPDLDHHDGTIARSVPAVRILGVTLVPSPTQAMAARIERASGGHRHLTHSLVGIGAATAAAAGLTLLHLPAAWAAALANRAGWVLSPEQIGRGRGVDVGVVLAAALLTAFAAKALRMTKMAGNDVGAVLMRTWVGPWVAGALVGVYTGIFLDTNRFVLLPAVVALGTFIHCLGDTLTIQGVAWLQPWHGPAPASVYAAAGRRIPSPGAAGSPKTRPARARAVFTRAAARAVSRCWPPNGYIRLPILGTAGSRREHVLNIALVSYSMWLLAHEAFALWAPGATAYVI